MDRDPARLAVSSALSIASPGIPRCSYVKQTPHTLSAVRNFCPAASCPLCTLTATHTSKQYLRPSALAQPAERCEKRSLDAASGGGSSGFTGSKRAALRAANRLLSALGIVVKGSGDGGVCDDVIGYFLCGIAVACEGVSVGRR